MGTTSQDIRDVFEENAVIPPPDKQKAVKKRMRFVIDSRDRNRTRYPTPSMYEISFDEPVQDVESMEVIMADIPFSRYLIHDHNNQLRVSTSLPVFDSSAGAFAFGGTTHTLVIEPGDYTHEELVTAVQSALQGVIPGATCTYVSRTERAAFDACGTPLSFQLQGADADYGPQEFAKVDTVVGGVKQTNTVKLGQKTTTYLKGSIGLHLGFSNRDQYNMSSIRDIDISGTDVSGIADLGLSVGARIDFADYSAPAVPSMLTGTGPYEVVAVSGTGIITLNTAVNAGGSWTRVANLSVVGGVPITSSQRMQLQQEPFLIMKVQRGGALHSPHKNIKGATAIVHNPKIANSVINYNHMPYFKRFNPIVNMMNTIKVSFVDYEGNLYNFEGMEHRFEIVFTIFKQSRKYGVPAYQVQLQ